MGAFSDLVTEQRRAKKRLDEAQNAVTEMFAHILKPFTDVFYAHEQATDSMAVEWKEIPGHYEAAFYSPYINKDGKTVSLTFTYRDGEQAESIDIPVSFFDLSFSERELYVQRLREETDRLIEGNVTAMMQTKEQSEHQKYLELKAKFEKDS